MILKNGINQDRFRTFVVLSILSGIALLLISPVSADTSVNTAGKPVVTIMTQGSQSYYLGEIVKLSGQNTDTDSTYLFITGPNIPSNGGKLTSPQQGVVSGNTDSFTVVKTKPDHTWDYSFYTANLPYDAGSYTLYAVSSPVAEKQFTDLTAYGTMSIILKRPFISAGISSPSINRGQPFTVTGIAEGLPPSVQIWMIGNNYASATKIPVNTDASFTFTADAALSGALPRGQNYLIVQHPMADNQFAIGISGDYVRDAKLNNGTNLFRITGPGSLQGPDAVDALNAAFNAHETHDDTYTNDTFTIVPFEITESTVSTAASPTLPPEQPTQQVPIQYAVPIGAGALVLVGIVLWKRH